MILSICNQRIYVPDVYVNGACTLVVYANAINLKIQYLDIPLKQHVFLANSTIIP